MTIEYSQLRAVLRTGAFHAFTCNIKKIITFADSQEEQKLLSYRNSSPPVKEKSEHKGSLLPLSHESTTADNLFTLFVCYSHG